jgi:hypothetical protein
MGKFFVSGAIRAAQRGSSEISFSRRRVVQGLVSAIPASVVLAGCQGGSKAPSGDSSSEPSFGVKPTVVVRSYDAADGQSPEHFTEQSLSISSTGVRPVSDRFELGDLCYEFAGPGSRITSETLAVPFAADFAVSFWFRSESVAPMRALVLRAPTTDLLKVEFNTSNAGVAVTYGDQVGQVVLGAGPGAYTDGLWRHLHVQLKAQMLELFVDGVLLGSVACQVVSPPQILVEVGGGNFGWIGAIDDVRIHTRSFDAADVPQMVYAWSRVHEGVNVGSFAAFYRCDEFDGVAVNDTGLAPDALTFNIAATTDRFGGERRAYQFDGQTAYLQLATPLDPVAGDFAIAFWGQTRSEQRMVAFSSAPGTRASLVIAVNDAGAAATVRIGDANIAVAAGGVSGQLADGQWHFYLVQRVGTELQLFVDGQLWHSVSCPLALWGPDSPIRIGRSFDADPAGDGYWNGAMDDVQIYRRSFPEEEAARLGTLAFWPRDGAGALAFDGRMWLLGGWNPSLPEVTNSELWCSTDGVEWTLAGEAPWEGRHNAGYAVFAGRMWVVGGDFNRGHYQNEVWSSTDGENWTLVTDSVPWQDRMGQHVVAFDGRLWLLGGERFTDDGSSIVLNDVYCSADGADWQQVTANAPWAGRSLVLGAAVFRGRMWIMGGGTYTSREFLNDVWCSRDGVSWEQVSAAAPWSPRFFHSIAVYHDKLWVIGGVDQQNVAGLNDVWYSDDGVNWTQLQNAPWEPRHAASVMVHDRHLWMAAGGANTLYNDVWRLGYAF